ncbi:hypothetical protein LTR56_004096 [Elasticomyces elasticus]|nr:hypothetical protein LTR56_004096 [Elasticomyces elasticus]KAK3661341.1 hypothetical protein LTR22_007548 [Elasticomyces elasticus]KAK4928964.1 hypothetical protein LTR49_004465 [Elasticomyces elasticus]KAK5765370.1 hypothetical protein LTS12_004383 [Elasticomyces elasticus]
MLLTQTSFLLALTTSVVAAAPIEKRWGFWGGWGHGNGRPWWTPSAESSYLEFGKRFPGAGANAPSCDLSQAAMPIAPTPLPAPGAGLSLSHVAIGRGTQNYTCDTKNATAVPVPVGAVAALFNVSCIAAETPELLSKLPNIALNLPVPSSDDQNSPAYQDMSGHHYFLDATTPFFNLDTSLHQYGSGMFKKSNVSAAPTDAVLGVNNQGNGSVQWLKLDAKNSTGQVFQTVYRLNTAGGNAPKSCTGMPAAFEVQYSSEYWIWSE